MYSERGVPLRKAMISRDATDEVEIRVNIQARLLFDLRREGHAERSYDERAELGVRYRYAGQPDAEWASTSFLHRFLENSGVRLGGMSDPGLYCTDVIPEGQLDLELFDVLAFDYGPARAIKEGVVVRPRVRQYEGEARTVDEFS